MIDTEHDEKQNDVEAPEGTQNEPDEVVDQIEENNPSGEQDEQAGNEPEKADEDGMSLRLHEALVKLDGRLQDHTDLPFDPDALDADSIQEAITNLIEKKPHLKKRRVGGDIGAGNRGNTAPETPDLIGIIRGMN